MMYSLNAIHTNRYSELPSRRPTNREHGKRNRLLVWLGGIVAVVGLVIPLYASNTDAQAGQTPVLITVHSGDTVWSIASKLSHGNEDPRSLEYRIIEANHLNDNSLVLTPGQKLRIP